MEENDSAAGMFPPPAAAGRTPWGIRDMLKAIGLILVGIVIVSVPAAIIAAAIAGSANVEDNPTALAIVLGTSVFLELFLLAAAFLFSVRKYEVSWRDLGLRVPSRGSFWLSPALVMGSLGLMYVYFGVLAAFGVEPDTDVPKQAFQNLGPLVVLGVVSLGFAPVMEELFFRGFVFGGLRGRWGTAFAALGSGVLFGVAHAGNPGTLYIIPPIALVGALFAWGYWYSGSIFTTMAAHFLFNLFSFSVGLATS